MSQFYILSLKHSPSPEGNAVWWRPKAAGYTSRLNEAGVYNQETIEADEPYYNNGESTAAWYKEAVDKLVNHTVEYRLVGPKAMERGPVAVLGFSEPEIERDEPVLYGRGELPQRDSRTEHDRTL